MSKKIKTPAVEPATVAEKPAVENQAPAVEPATVAIEITKPFLDSKAGKDRQVGEIVELSADRANYIIDRGFAKISK